MFKKILVATTNIGKLEEYKKFLELIGFEVVSLKDEQINEEAPENGNSYTEIAENKAKFYAKYTHLPSVAEDSGLEVFSLVGFPGINSNRWMNGSDEDKNQGILNKLKGITDRRAVFKTVIVYIHGKTLVRFAGELHGEIAIKSKGSMGFGYDPIFYIPSLNKTLAELILMEKNKISHRAHALQKLASYLKKYRLK